MEKAEKATKSLSQGKRRRLTGAVAFCVTALAISWSLFHLYTTIFGTLDVLVHRAVHLTFALALGLVLFSAAEKLKESRVALGVDIILALAGISVGVYVVSSADKFADRVGLPIFTDYIFGAIAILLILELTRRILGPAMPLVAAVLLIYAYTGEHWPYIFSHPGCDLGMITSSMLISLEGIYGVAMGVSATMLVIFIILAQFLIGTGTAQFFMDLSTSLIGWARGGPAKIAVISSGFFGSISGSPVANVLSTGSVTIPMMKNLGYRPSFAGAVEAVASTGGQLMPPVMGASAFVMAEVLGVPYIKVCIAALIPAILYYLALLIMVDLEAAKTNLVGVARDKLIPLRKTLKDGWFHAIPMLVLLYLIIIGYSPQISGVAAIAACIIINIFNKKQRLSWKQYLKILEEGGLGTIMIACACATAGIIIGSFNMTGLGPNLSSILIELSGGYKAPLLVLTMVSSLIMGMALPTIICYIILAVLVAPALVTMGVEPMAAHLFVLYFGVLGFVTPPVAFAAYAGATLAGANAMKTGWTASRLAICAYILPFMFVYSPQLLLMGVGYKLVLAVISSLIGVTAISMGVQGYIFRPIKIWQRVLLCCSGMALIDSGLLTDLFGYSCFGLVVASEYLINKKSSKAALES